MLMVMRAPAARITGMLVFIIWSGASPMEPAPESVAQASTKALIGKPCWLSRYYFYWCFIYPIINFIQN
jgi:hypothetical protein